MESLSINDREGDLTVDKPLVFDESYNDPSANMILTSCDDISFRVHDFYPKAASRVFRDMLSLPTNGGAIGLPETAAAIRMVLDKLTGTDRKYDPSLTNQIAAYRLAKRFDMHGAISLSRNVCY